MLRGGLPARTFLNLNVPPGQPKGLRVTVQAKRNHVTVVNPRAGSAGPRLLLDRGRGERVGAARPLGLPGGARTGYVSVTPLQLGPDRARDASALVETLLGQQLSERAEQLLLDPRVEVE